MEITQEIAERIINGKSLIEQALVPYKGIEVSYVGFVDADGEPFLWEDTEEPYAIVSFKAMNEHQLNQSVEEFADGDYESAVNHNLSMRMDVVKAREICKGTPGTLICHEVEVGEEGAKETALLPKNFVPAVAVVAKTASLADRLAKRKAPVAEPAVKLDVATPVGKE